MDPTVAAATMTSTMVASDMVATTPHSEGLPPTLITSSASSAPATPELDASPFASPRKPDDEPLYTEINIPLPPLPKQRLAPNSETSRPRAHTLHSFRPFHRRGSSSDSTGSKKSEEWPRIRKEIKNREVASAMNLAHRHKRSGTIDALAVVPAVLVLSAELFTPGEEGRKRKKDEGNWENGMI